MYWPPKPLDHSVMIESLGSMRAPLRMPKPSSRVNGVPSRSGCLVVLPVRQTRITPSGSQPSMASILSRSARMAGLSPASRTRLSCAMLTRWAESKYPAVATVGPESPVAAPKDPWLASAPELVWAATRSMSLETRWRMWRPSAVSEPAHAEKVDM